MAKYFGAIRWADDAVAAINWDNEEKTGTVTVTDETTGEVYEIGGSTMGALMKCTATLDDGDYVLDKSFKELKEAVDAGFLPYLEIETPGVNTTFNKQLILAALDKQTQTIEGTTTYHYRAVFGTDLSGILFVYLADTDTEPMVLD